MPSQYNRGNNSPRPFRGRGRGGARGGSGFRGRGRGRGAGVGTGRGASPSGQSPSPFPADVDFEGDFESFTRFAGQFGTPARPQPRRARGNIAIVDRGYISRPRISSRGLGYVKTAKEEHVFKQWEATRPLLQPVKFVRAIAHKTLFEEIDDLITVPKPPPEVEGDHMPTARQVSGVFGTETTPHISMAGHSEMEEVEALLEPSPTISIDLVIDDVHKDASEPAVSEVDAVPTLPDEDLIVYEAPQPRQSSRAPSPKHPDLLSDTPPLIPPVTMETLTFSFQEDVSLGTRSPVKSPRKTPQTTRRRARLRQEKSAVKFGSFGALLEEERLHYSSGGDPRKSSRRQDSDVDWGGSDSDLNLGESNDDMLDPDINQDSFGGFLKSIRGLTSNPVTLDDIEDQARIQQEDEDELIPNSSDSVSPSDDLKDDQVPEVEDTAGSESDSSEVDSSDLEESPGHSFQKRLSKIRSASNGRNKRHKSGAVSVDDLDENFVWSDGDDDFMTEMQRILDDNRDLLQRDKRKERKSLLTSIVNGDFHEPSSLNGTKADRHIPTHLQDQWERDRAKKADRKHSRQIARMQEAAEFQSKKTRKRESKRKYDIVKAGLIDPESGLPQAKVDLISMEAEIRDFVMDLGGRDCLILPPMSKDVRASIHQLANAFHLKSKSQGKGDGRFTILYRTTMTGVNIKDWKVEKLVYGNRKRVPSKHKDGDEVGKSAPKIGEGNIGFKMLQQMGWEEGDRIGVTGGLDAPITAIIKNTKLGLGASR